MTTELNNNDLDNDLEQYSWNVRHLDRAERDKIKTLYTSWKSALNNKIFIENVKDANIRINDYILINGVKFSDKQITNKAVLHFINCEKVTIIINSKVAHITLEKCIYVNIKTTGGSISGVDDIHCSHISHVLEKSGVYFVDVSTSQDCNYYIPEHLATDTIISAYSAFNIHFTMLQENGRIIKKMSPANSFFNIYKLYCFINRNGTLELIENTST